MTINFNKAKYLTNIILLIFNAWKAVLFETGLKICHGERTVYK